MPGVDTPTRQRTPAKAPPPLQARRPSRMGLFWRRRSKLAWPAAAVAVMVALAVGGTWAVRGVRSGNTVASLPERLGIGAGLVVDEIRIEGREKTPENFLRAALGVSKGDKLLGFSLDAARARIEKLTWVQHATVERHLPGTIVVRLEERRPFAVWQNGGKFQLIDRTGEVVVQQDPGKDADAFKTLPLVVGPGAQEAAASLLDGLAALPALRSRVVAAVRVGERRWNLHLNNGADVLLPEGAEGRAMTKLMELQTSQSLLDRPLQVVDMRLPDRLVVQAHGQRGAAGEPGGEEAVMNDVTRRRSSKLPEPDLLQTLVNAGPTEPLPPRVRSARSGTFGVLDVGTTKVCCLVGRTDPDGTMRVIGSAMRASRGVRAGGIVDLDAASHSIAGVVGEAEDKAGQRIEHYLVNLSCGQPESRLYTVEWPVGGRAITEHDLRRVVQEGGRRALLAGREIIHVVPLMFAVDETQGVLDPRRMHCDQLKARLHVIDAAASAVHNLMATIGRCKLQLEELVSSPLASGLATLVEDERQLGTTVIDMGGGTTDMAVFSEGQLLHTAHLRIGGLHITKDIAQGLSTPLAQAERLKTLYGSALPSPDDEREMLPISLVGEEEHDVHKIPRSRVISIIVPRLEETFEMVRAQLDAAGISREAGHRVVLTGGASQMPGLRDMATRMLGGQVRLGKPAHVRGLPDLASGPAFATASGLLAWASGSGRQLADVKLEEDGPPTLLARIVKYIGDRL